MNLTASLKGQERISVLLRGLYESYGYRPFKVSQFEEYEYYMRNKNFLTSEQVLTFSDANGKLMALKPDITLSVVRVADGKSGPLKVSYAETAYRVPKGAYGFREIMQCGLEYMGEMHPYVQGEVLMLAACSLALISDNYVLDVSDMGILKGILSGEVLSGDEKTELMTLISRKNLHTLETRAQEMGVSEEGKRLLTEVGKLYGPLQETMKALEALRLPTACDEALENLRLLTKMAEAQKLTRIHLDFSVVNDMGYYNGLIFTGFIDGIPTSVLSGGRYDPLMRRMGKPGGAVGFAVYLDQLERLLQEHEEYDEDVLLLCDPGADPCRIAEEAARLTSEGKRANVQFGTEPASRAREVIRLGKAEEA